VSRHVIHHCGYDTSRPRGHSSQQGAVDTQISVARAGDIVTMTTELMRDGPEGVSIVSKAEVIELGLDNAGRAITSLVVIPSDEAPITAARGAPKSWTVLRTALRWAINEYGEPFQLNVGEIPMQVVDASHVRGRFYSTYTDFEEEDEERRKRKVRKAFGRAMQEALDAGMIGQFTSQETGRTLLWPLQ
jgi:hypothetical protein